VRRIFLILAALLILATCVAAAAAGYLSHWYKSAGPLTQDITIIIEPKTGFEGITGMLVDKGVIDNPTFFKAMAVITGQHSRVKAGEYIMEAGISPGFALGVLVRGESVVHSITVREGERVADIRAQLLADERLSGDLTMQIPEGTLMPDTYFIHRGDSRQGLVARMQKPLQEALRDIWARRGPNLPYKEPEEALTMASIVEKETGVASERPRVAAVFVNRLRLGMPLQSDPTVAYGIELQQGPLNRALTKADLKADHAFNTYLYRGLPPQPIACPGKASLEAAMNPPVTDELYFVATGNGGHFFSSNLTGHNRNVAKYRSELARQRANTEQVIEEADKPDVLPSVAQ